MLLHKQIFCLFGHGRRAAGKYFVFRQVGVVLCRDVLYVPFSSLPALSGAGQYGGEAGVFQTACQPLCFFEGIQIILMTRAPVEMDGAAAVLADKVEQDAADGGVACAGCQQDDGFAAIFLQGKRTERTFNADDAFFFDFGFAAENHFRADTVFAPADV